MFTKFVISIACLVSLAACGGGGSYATNEDDSRDGPDQPAEGEVLQTIIPNIGIGVHQLSYWDRSFAMADVVRQARFVNLTWGVDVGADAQGAPTQDFLLIFGSHRTGAGKYTLMFNGRADVSVRGAPNVSVQNLLYDAKSNRSTADVVLPEDVSGNIWLSFRNTRRAQSSSISDGVTNVQLWRPGYPTDGSVTFTKEFIQAMKKFKVIRTMDLVSTNTNPTATWSERTLPSFVGMTGDKGQSWELLVALANATERDLWINLPVKADDEYIRNLALLLRYGSDGVMPYTSRQTQPKYPPLKTGIKVYVEYGNEVWNFAPGFNGFRWALELANLHRMNPAHPIANDGVVGDQYLALRRWIAFRSAQISQTFRQVWGDSAMMRTIRPIFATQAGDANRYLSNGLAWAESYYGDVTRLWYGGGGAAYYDSTVEPTDLLPSTMQAYFDGLPSSQFARTVSTDSVWTKAYGLRNVAYEGGPGPGGHTLSPDSARAEIAYAYNADPRMRERMHLAQDIWQANGGDLLVYYVYSSSASWSFSDGSRPLTRSDTDSTKMQFVSDLSDALRPVPPFVLGTPVPGTVYLRSPDASIQTRIGGNTTWGYNGTAYRINANAQYPAHSETVLVPIHTRRPGTYSVSVNTLDALATDRLDIFANGQLAGQVSPGVTTTPGQPVATTSLAVRLPEGLSVVRVRARVGSVWIRDLVVSAN